MTLYFILSIVVAVVILAIGKYYIHLKYEKRTYLLSVREVKPVCYSNRHQRKIDMLEEYFEDHRQYMIRCGFFLEYGKEGEEEPYDERDYKRL